jgi:hypothetical protein
MGRLPREGLWRPARDLPFLVLAVAVAASMVRSIDQPDVDVDVAGTEVTMVPADLALLALGVVVVQRLLGRGALPRPARATTLAAAAFSAWLVASSAVNGSDAFVGALKLLEYGVLALGVVLIVRRRGQLWLLAGLLVAITVLADVRALVGFVERPGERQASFLGEHDFAALATMSLVLGIAALYSREHRLGRLPLVAAIAGALGVALSAALAGLLGLYLAIVATLAIAAARRAVTMRALAITVGVAGIVTASALALRSGDLGFLEKWFGTKAEDVSPSRYSAGWSQRLIYAYVGGRIFLDNPLTGTGWYGELPPREFARYLPDAHARFPDEPPHYFPPRERTFIPQQTYDQVLYELGIVGALLFLALAVATGRTAVAVVSRWPRDGPDEIAAYLPAAWLASLAGALAGAALFGGIPLTAMFWLTLGVVALAPSLVPAAAASVPPPRRRTPVTVAR